MTTTLAPPDRSARPALASRQPSPAVGGGFAIESSIGFASTVAMWAVGYVCMTAPGLVLGEILFGLMLLALLAASAVAGRLAPPAMSLAAPWRRGLVVGLVSATVNLLVVGSLIGSGSSRGEAAAWIGGLYLVSAAVGVVGGVIGGRLAPWSRPVVPLGLFAAVAATAVFLLLITGGLVTGMEAGLAVPDWPNSFGHNMLLYPLSEMTGGIYYEHAHRLYGMLVGLTSLVFAILAWWLDRRRVVRATAIAVLVMVCVQGLLGGLRVTGTLTLSQDSSQLAPNLTLAIVHGVFGQVIFATFCGLAAATSLAWRSAFVRGEGTSSTDRVLATLLPVGFVLQTIFGACYRHLQVHGEGGLVEHPVWALHVHITLGVLVAALAVAVGLRSWGSHGQEPALRRLGLLLIAAISLQLVLGLGALVAVFVRGGVEIPLWELLVTSAHQATGALLLGVAVLIALWTRRLAADGVARTIVA